MQNTFQIPTSDNHLIHGTLNSAVKTDKLIIFAHGLTGNQHEHQYFNAPGIFNPKGYDTFRFDFYSPAEKGRQISDCSISVHVEDLEKVIEHFRPQYPNIYLIGHSLGCAVILNSNKVGIEKIIYWDPTKGMKSLEQKNITFNDKAGLYILQWGLEIQMSRQFIDDWKEASDLENQVKKLTPNSYFVFAGNYNIYPAWKEYLSDYPMAVVPNATHRFVEEGVLEGLYEETLKFLED